MAATIEPPDVIDLAESLLWVTPKTRNDIAFLGPALVVYFACCGATPTEAMRATRGSFRPNNSDRILLPGHKGVRPRAVPLIRFAKLKLQAYISATQYNSDEDPLFKDTNGRPIPATTITDAFKALGIRIGLDGNKIPTRLRAAFLRWVDHCPTQCARLYLRGAKVDAATMPSFSQTKEELEIALQPLASLDRQGLRQGGAVARNFPRPDFPVLSRDGWSDISASQKARGWLPHEVLRAVQGALWSGKSIQQVSRHYGISERTVGKYVRDGFPFERTTKLGQPSTRRAIIKYVRANPGCNASQLTEWINGTFGTRAARPYVLAMARLFGLKLAAEPYRSVQREAVTTAWPIIKAEIIRDPTITNADVAKIVDNVTGLEIRPTTLFNHLHARKDMPSRAKVRISTRRTFLSRFSLDFARAFEAVWPDLKNAILDDPTLSNAELATIFETKSGMHIHRDLLGTHLRGRSDVPFRKGRRGPLFRHQDEESRRLKAERAALAELARSERAARRAARDSKRDINQKKWEAFDATWPLIRIRLLEDPTINNFEIAHMVEEATGVVMIDQTVDRYMARRADVPFRAPHRGQQCRLADGGHAGRSRDAFDAAWPCIKAELTQNPSLSDREIIHIMRRQTGEAVSNATVSKYIAEKPDAPVRMSSFEALEVAWPTIRQELLRDPTLTEPEIAEIVQRETKVPMSVSPVKRFLATRSDVPKRSRLRGARFRPGAVQRPTKFVRAFDEAWRVVKRELQRDRTLTDSDIIGIVKQETGVCLSLPTIHRYMSARPDAPPRSELRGKRQGNRAHNQVFNEQHAS